MSEDQNPLEGETEKPVKTAPSAAITKLLLLVGIVFALTKWGLPFMNNMVDEFKKNQKSEEKEVIVSEEKRPSGQPAVEDPIPILIASDEAKLQSAIENEINLWVKKQSPEASARVKYINTNSDGSKLAVEYEVSNAAGETESKELLFKKDEFGIFIYEDTAGVRQIRVRQPK